MLEEKETKPKIVLVMGVTGAGKSYLISKISGQSVKVGDSLESCTSEVDIVHMKHPNGGDVVLLDTPGFDDTNRSDTEILEVITAYLFGMYKSEVKITGIIYVHRISDPRMQGTAMKNLRMFEQLCGDKTFNNVVLLTTRWDSVSYDIGERRETELKEKYWNLIRRKGAKVMRYVDSSDITEIMGYLLGKEGTNLLIQEELSQGKKLVETGAGNIINKELADAEKKYKEDLEYARVQMEEAIKQKDEETRLLIQQEAEETARKIAKIQEDRDALERNLNSELAVLREEGEEAKRNVERIQEQTRKMEEEYKKKQEDMEKSHRQQQEKLEKQEQERRAEADRRFEIERKDREHNAKQMMKMHEDQMKRLTEDREERRAELDRRFQEEKKDRERREEEMKKEHQEKIAKMKEEESRRRDEMEKMLEEEKNKLYKERKNKYKITGVLDSAFGCAFEILTYIPRKVVEHL